MRLFSAEFDAVRSAEPLGLTGRVRAVRGLTVLAGDLPAPVGSLVRVGLGGSGVVRGEIVGFDHAHAVVMMLGGTGGIVPGAPVELERVHQAAGVGDRLLGRVIDGLGRPIDGLGPITETVLRPLDPEPTGAMVRRRITEPLRTGVRAIDLMTPVGRGQRLGVFAGPGVGKSTVLGQIARGTDADVSVIALIGERGREVREFIDDALGREGLARSVVVVSTGDESPLMRIRAARFACAAAEYFRDRGKNVLLMMDSVTRFAHAGRQIGLAVGEPPASKGYTPSVFTNMAVLLERAGAVEVSETSGGGSITGLYTILVEGDDMTEPVADAARGILDGHVVLSRKLAQRGHFPAVDVLDSVSRVAGQIMDQSHAAARQQFLRLLAKYREIEELVQIGAYATGADPEADTAIDLSEPLNELLRQRSDEPGRFEQALSMMVKLALQSGEMIEQRRRMRAAQQPQAQPRGRAG
ncbi:MAG: FliI/YscN family ATPase [Phycisphaerales bacterium]|nr:FliI/YscN family ATPase [Planctomycetota bacterium]MCH8508538.1 FliI/YscN family ATPase [Phycisphaerales bacterium]